MQKDVHDVFEDYKDLYELTKKTVDEHIEFYKKKKFLSETDLLEIWERLSKQSESFDKRNWTENWPNWHKNFNAFEKHKYEAKFLIQYYLTNVLEELVKKLTKEFRNAMELTQEKAKYKKNEISNIQELIKQEVKRQITLKLAIQKSKPKNSDKK